MPPWPKPKSQAQRGAMYAAAEGRSTIGIPASVGKEFAKGDKGGKLPGHKRKATAAGREIERRLAKRDKK